MVLVVLKGERKKIPINWVWRFYLFIFYFLTQLIKLTYSKCMWFSHLIFWKYVLDTCKLNKLIKINSFNPIKNFVLLIARLMLSFEFLSIRSHNLFEIEQYMKSMSSNSCSFVVFMPNLNHLIKRVKHFNYNPLICVGFTLYILYRCTYIKLYKSTLIKSI